MRIIIQQFQAHVAEVRTTYGDQVLEDILAQPELPELEAIEEDQQEDVSGPDPKKKKVTRTARTEFLWERRDFASKSPPIFPEANYSTFRGLSPKGLYEQFIDRELLDNVARLSNEYAMAKFGVSYDVTSEEVNVYFAILLLSGYNRNVDYDLYWSQSEDCENKMVKAAMTRNRFRTIKKCIHFGSIEDREGETPDRYKKVRLLVKHMQDRFGKLFVPEQNLSHDEAMIKYFGKSGLKQAIRNCRSENWIY
jgi:hypothetical protein